MTSLTLLFSITRLMLNDTLPEYHNYLVHPHVEKTHNLN